MSDAIRKNPTTDLLKRGYSDQEIANLYELGRLCLENGDLPRAEVIFVGLTQVAPDFAAAWIGLAYVYIHNRNYDEATFASRQALRIDPNFVEAMLFLITCLLTTGDYHSAGSYLGEVGEQVDSGMISDPNAIRFFRSQMARFQNR